MRLLFDEPSGLSAALKVTKAAACYHTERSEVSHVSALIVTMTNSHGIPRQARDDINPTLLSY